MLCTILQNIVYDVCTLFDQCANNSSVKHMVLYVTGYNEESGTLDGAFLITINQTICNCTRCTTFTVSNQKTLNAEKVVTLGPDLKDSLQTHIEQLCNKDSKMLNKLCVSFFIPVEGQMTEDDIVKVQHDINNLIRHHLCHDLKGRHRKGPRLDNQEILWSPILSRTLSISFIFNPMYIERSLEIIGLSS